MHTEDGDKNELCQIYTRMTMGCNSNYGELYVNIQKLKQQWFSWINMCSSYIYP